MLSPVSDAEHGIRERRRSLSDVLQVFVERLMRRPVDVAAGAEEKTRGMESTARMSSAVGTIISGRKEAEPYASKLKVGKQEQATVAPFRDSKLFPIGAGTQAKPAKPPRENAGMQRRMKIPDESYTSGSEAKLGEKGNNVGVAKQEQVLQGPPAIPRFFPYVRPGHGHPRWYVAGIMPLRND